jgi:hypothetical protein
MLTMVGCSRALASLLVVVAMMTSTLAACAEGASASATEQMACCKAGHDHCPMKDSAADCCKKNSSSPQPQWNVVAKADSLNAPDRVVLMFVSPANPLSDAALLVQPVRAAALSPPLRPVGPPVYIAFSTLLI